jgi:hypothetical protein
VGTHREPKKNEKNIVPLSNLKRGKKKQGTLSACLGLLPIGCMKFLFPKELG